MSSLSYQDQNELYKQITEYLAPAAAEPKVPGINRIKIQIAERIVMKFPSLRLEENKYALLMAVDVKFNDLKNVIIQHEKEREYQAIQISEADRRLRSMLEKMGVLPTPPSDRNNRRGVVISDDLDQDIPF